MKKYFKVGGFLVAGFGLFILLIGKSSGVVPGIIFTLIGAALIAFGQFSGEISRKHARKELMELKSLLDNGILTNDEYEEKSKVLKNKI
ncbi:MAG: SHOCT domain-containing protein [Methylococcaceae bacterium]